MKTIRCLSDGELIKAYVNENSQKAALALYERYEQLIKMLINKATLSYEDKQDLFQDIVIRIFDSLAHSYREQGCFKKWVATICMNSLYSHLRLCKRNRTDNVPEESFDTYPSEYHPTNFVIQWEKTYKYLKSAITEQPPESGKILTMLYKEQKSYREIAQELGMSKSGCHKKVQSILLKMKQHLLQHGIKELPDDDISAISL